MPDPTCPLCGGPTANISQYRNVRDIVCVSESCRLHSDQWPAVQALKDENDKLKAYCREQALRLRRVYLTGMGMGAEEIEDHCNSNSAAVLADEVDDIEAWQKIQDRDRERRLKQSQPQAEADDREAMYSALYDCHCLIGKLIPNGHVDNTEEIREVKRKASAVIDAYCERAEPGEG